MTSLPLFAYSCDFRLDVVVKGTCKAKIQMNVILRVGIKLILYTCIFYWIGK